MSAPYATCRWIAALAVLETVLRAQQATLPPPEKDPFVGQWKANATKSRPRLSKKEASYERTISREGDYLVFASSGGVSKAAIRQFKILCDGLFHPLPTGPVLSCGYSAPNRVDGETKDPNHSNLFWTREISPDGQEMTISEYKDKARSKLRLVMVLDRVK
jgi:hypothetical protein